MKKRIYWKRLLAVLVLFICYVVLGAVIPFMEQPDVSEETVTGFCAEHFYGEEVGVERAAVISDNEEALEERIRLISGAQDSIILSTFEFDADESGKDMLAALMDAAERGVKVSVLADGFPSILSMKGNAYFYALSLMENVEIKIYNPVNVLHPWKLMGRLHDKYLIVDNTAYIAGGRNTYDYFLGEGTGYINYDWDVLVYCEGGSAPSMDALKAYYQNIWSQPECRSFGGNKLKGWFLRASAAEQELRERYAAMKKDNPEWFERVDYRTVTNPVKKITLLTNPVTPYAKEPVVYYQMTALMENAKEEVRFHTPYIICNDWMLQRLETVCSNTDRVTMMTNSVANNGNYFGAMDYAEHRDDILHTSVNILEYDGGISYHGKCFIMDNDITGIGSFNWDMRSAYMDTELMLIIHSEELNADMRKEMTRYEKEALTVIDSDTTIAPDGKSPQSSSATKSALLKLLKITVGWARFLM